MGSFESNRLAIVRLYKETLEGIALEADLLGRFRLICERYDSQGKPEDLFFENPWRTSMVRRLLQVNERLRLVRSIERDLGEDFERRYLYSSLAAYLTLTCFDQLGQPAKWLTFDAWLLSRKTKDEREAVQRDALSQAKDSYALALFQHYQSIYGVKSSFFRFLRKVLPWKQHEAMFKQLRIEHYSDFPSYHIVREGTTEECEKYLYRVRNEYTHNVYARGSWHDMYSADKDKEWRENEVVYGKGSTHRILTTRNFFQEMKESVRQGLWCKIVSESD